METQPEREVVNDVTARLRTRFPHLTDDALRPMVTAVLASYQDSRVLDFVPILAEREVVTQLRSRGPDSHAG
jgi:hypothetical protein